MSNIATRVMNDEALRTALRAMVPAQAEGIEQLYVLLNDAQQKGYAQGLSEGNGIGLGQSEIERGNAWDDGYAQGVQDARANPAKADRIVQEIIADGAAAYYDAAEEAVENWTAYAESVRD